MSEIATADATTLESFEDFCSHHGLCGTSELKTSRNESPRESLIEGVLAARQICLFAGDSGTGKSPFLYQATICVAADQPFIDLPTKKAAVLYIDYENSREDSSLITGPMLPALGLSETPQLWKVLNVNDVPERIKPRAVVEGWLKRPELQGMPKIVVIDPLEEWDGRCIDNKHVREIYRVFRVWARDYNAATITVHHTVKEPTRREDRDGMARLEDDPRRWLQRTHGGKVLTNASDVRLGMAEYVPLAAVGDAAGDEVFTIAGYRRSRGRIGPLRVRRELGGEGEAVRYVRCHVSELLPHDESCIYETLTPTFEVKDMKQAGVTHNQQCSRILRRWQEMGLVTKLGRGRYQKLPGN